MFSNCKFSKNKQSVLVRLLLVLISSFALNFLQAQPLNNDCVNAIDLGQLPSPPPFGCPNGLLDGAVRTVTGSALGASIESPVIVQGNCQGTPPNNTNGDLDVWYKFKATGTTLNILLTDFPNAILSLWRGTMCGNLQPYGCAVADLTGVTRLKNEQISIGTTYYLSIGGNASSAPSAFVLNLDNDIDCDDCMRQSELIADPLPEFGAYKPDQVVKFCFRITEWRKMNTNWLHGVQISIGSGWTGEITNVAASSPCNTNQVGKWMFLPNGLGVVNAINWGPGYYFEQSVNENNPKDNLGDECFGANVSWEFCFSLKVKPGCAPGADLSVMVNTSGDGESGSWNNAGCKDDAPTRFSAIGSCCPPTVSHENTCEGTSNGSASVFPVGNLGPFQYHWTPGDFVTSSISNLPAGNYKVVVTDKNNCAVSASVVVLAIPTPQPPTVTPVKYCKDAPTSALTATPAEGNSLRWYGLLASGGTGATSPPTPSSALVGSVTYYVSQITRDGCESERIGIQVTVIANPAVTVNSARLCAGQTVVLTAEGATSYQWLNSGGQIGASITVGPSITSIFTVVGTTAGCSTRVSATVEVDQPFQIGVNSPTICAGKAATLTATGAATYVWGNGSSSSSIEVTPMITTTFTVTGSKGACTAKGDAVVTVIALPTASITAPLTMCSGVSAQVQVSGTPNSVINYTVSGNDQSTASILLVNIGASGSATITTPSLTQNIIYHLNSVTLASANACKSLLNDQVTIEVIEMPDAHISENQSVCLGSDVTVYFSGTPNARIYYAVDNGVTQSTTLNTAGNFAIQENNILVSKSYTLIKIAVDGNASCVKEIDETSDISVNPLPIAEIPTSIEVCEGSKATIDFQGTADATIFYTYNGISEQLVLDQNGNGRIVTPQLNESLNFIFTNVVSTNPIVCEQALTNSFTVQVRDLPFAVFSGDVTKCAGENEVIGIDGSPLAVLSYRINSGSNNTVAIGADGKAALQTGVLSTDIRYQSTQIEWPNEPRCATALNQSTKITVISPIEVTFEPNVKEGCVPFEVHFTSNTSASNTCTWNFGDGAFAVGCGSVSHTYTEAGNYSVELSTTAAGADCKSSLMRMDLIHVSDTPVAAFEASPTTISDTKPTVVFTNQSTGGDSYVWNFGDGATSEISNPVHTYKIIDDASYTVALTAISKYGCKNSAYVTIETRSDLIYYVPNSFTPDLDNFNQVFKPVLTAGVDVLEYGFAVYNRWGEQVFESHDTTAGWDGTYKGKRAETGSYTWSLSLKSSHSTERKSLTGHVNLLK